VFIRFTIALSLAASLWGQKLGQNQGVQNQGVQNQGVQNLGLVPADIPRAEDSLESYAANKFFYDNPRGAQPEPVPQAAATISAEQLRHPLSRKGASLIRQARNFAAMGRHDKAIAELQPALQEPSAIPYAHSLLGSEYLRVNQVPAALVELEQAVALLPRNAADRSNLAYALFLSGDLERGEREVRQALDIDRNNPTTRRVLNQILDARQTQGQTEP
jgi:Flp pilus assembly protein TadD